MRYTRKVSMWPVGLVTKYGVSSPIVRDGKLTGYYDGWIGGRKYPVDMAGFAVAVKFLLERPKAHMPFMPGYEEDGFLRSLAPLNNNEIELLANNCTEVPYSIESMTTVRNIYLLWLFIIFKLFFLRIYILYRMIYMEILWHFLSLL